MIDNIEHNTQIEETKINNVHFGDDIGQHPQEHLTRIFFSKRQRVRTQHHLSHSANYMHRNSRQSNRYCVSNRNKHQLKSPQRKTSTQPYSSQTMEEITYNHIQHRKQSDNTLSTRRDSNNLNKQNKPTHNR